MTIPSDAIITLLRHSGPLTSRDVASRLRATLPIVSTRLSRLAAYGKISRQLITESKDAAGITRTFCLWGYIAVRGEPWSAGLLSAGA